MSFFTAICLAYILYLVCKDRTPAPRPTWQESNEAAKHMYLVCRDED
jgi:hypothetical protein